MAVPVLQLDWETTHLGYLRIPIVLFIMQQWFASQVWLKRRSVLSFSFAFSR